MKILSPFLYLFLYTFLIKIKKVHGLFMDQDQERTLHWTVGFHQITLIWRMSITIVLISIFLGSKLWVNLFALPFLLFSFLCPFAFFSFISSFSLCSFAVFLLFRLFPFLCSLSFFILLSSFSSFIPLVFFVYFRLFSFFFFILVSLFSEIKKEMKRKQMLSIGILL